MLSLKKKSVPWVHPLYFKCLLPHAANDYLLGDRGFPGGARGKEPTCQCRRPKRHRLDPWVRKIPWRKEWQPTAVFLPGESHGQKSLAGYSPWGHRRVRRLSTQHTWEIENISLIVQNFCGQRWFCQGSDGYYVKTGLFSTLFLKL